MSIKDIDLAYFAGAFDGEGCIHIRKAHRTNGRIDYSLQCTVSNTNEWLPLAFKLTFGGHIREVTPQSDDRVMRRPWWHWCIQTRQAGDFLLSIYPYLNLKKAEATLALAFQDTKTTRGHRGNKSISDEERAVEEAQYILMRQLKH